MNTVHAGTVSENSALTKETELSSVLLSDDTHIVRAIEILRQSSGSPKSESFTVSAESSATPSPRSMSYSEQRIRFKHAPTENQRVEEGKPQLAASCYIHSLPLTHWDAVNSVPVCLKCRNDGSIEAFFTSVLKDSRTLLLASIETAISGLETVLGELRQSQTAFEREAQYVRRVIQEELLTWLARVEQEEIRVRRDVAQSVKEVADRKKRLGEIFRDLMDAENFCKLQDMIEFIRGRASVSEAVRLLTSGIRAPLADRRKIDRIKLDWDSRGRGEVSTPEIIDPIGKTDLDISSIISGASSLVDFDRKLRKEGSFSETEIDKMLVYFELATAINKVST